MSNRTITFKECDGCFKDTYNDAIEIVTTRARYGDYDESGRTVDLCNECRDAGKFICSFCHEIHDDAHPCELMRQRIAEAEAAMRSQFAETPIGIALDDDELPY